mmetsp:Transcript_57787/g.118266  ORF Transcript_57787/g.118266 Transcript_57787/m.118266 type:complete len:209 (-) Transcript_57787:267-893(-)
MSMTRCMYTFFHLMLPDNRLTSTHARRKTVLMARRYQYVMALSQSPWTLSQSMPLKSAPGSPIAAPASLLNSPQTYRFAARTRVRGTSRTTSKNFLHHQSTPPPQSFHGSIDFLLCMKFATAISQHANPVKTKVKEKSPQYQTAYPDFSYSWGAVWTCMSPMSREDEVHTSGLLTAHDWWFRIGKATPKLVECSLENKIEARPHVAVI